MTIILYTLIYYPMRPAAMGDRRKFMDLHLKDIVELKKTHPCGSKQWEITRVGMDIKLKCLGCGHELMLPRSKVEKSIKKIVPHAAGTEGGTPK